MPVHLFSAIRTDFTDYDAFLQLFVLKATVGMVHHSTQEHCGASFMDRRGKRKTQPVAAPNQRECNEFRQFILLAQLLVIRPLLGELVVILQVKRHIDSENNHGIIS